MSAEHKCPVSHPTYTGRGCAICGAERSEVVSAPRDVTGNNGNTWQRNSQSVDGGAREMEQAELSEFIETITNACQVFDGWHNDGTAWSEWDESVRQKLSKCLARLYEVRAAVDRRKR
jgi:hypothetical protein